VATVVGVSNSGLLASPCYSLQYHWSAGVTWTAMRLERTWICWWSCVLIPDGRVSNVLAAFRWAEQGSA